MDNKWRADVEARLLEAMARRSRVDRDVQTHVERIGHVRKTLGNPYFYHPRPANHPESETKYTGYTSHDPGLKLLRAREGVEQEIDWLLRELRRLEE